ncbi:MAG: hypothetical protein GY862_10420 [Gammaproteobacteria bacterium]|nr:hypothetical protein [Gammaproteobacteria bacterium]
MLRSPQLRLQLAREAARIMVQDSIDDYQTAKYKAAAKLGFGQARHLPGNSEIEEALLEYQRLFCVQTQPLQLRQQRKAALSAMRLFARFNPRLVGSVFSGTANEHTDICLHLFSEPHEEVALFLMDRNIPYQTSERRFNGIQKRYPGYRFIAGAETVVLVVFPEDGIRWSPPSPVDGKPMRRADVNTLEALLEVGNVPHSHCR